MRETNEKIKGVCYEKQFNKSAIEIGKLINIRDIRGKIKTFKDSDGNFKSFVKDVDINFMELVIVETNGKEYMHRINWTHLDSRDIEIDPRYLREVRTDILDSKVFSMGKGLEFMHSGKLCQGIVQSYEGDSALLLISDAKSKGNFTKIRIYTHHLVNGDIKIV
ncbi:hypothetical protein UT300012_22140 [Paraclostridium bifermentans]